jgi:predicted DsbA family dithiol-disulfide isomerase
VRVEIWSDVVCPWCYIGRRRFQKALASFRHGDSVEVVHRSFQLDPTAEPGGSRNAVESLSAKYGIAEAQARAAMAGVEEVARSEGLEYHLASTGTGNTFDAHRVVHLAAAHGLQDTVVERLFRAHFLEGISVFDHEGLVKLGADAGLDPVEVARVLADGTFADAVRADGLRAHALGATGVPFFVTDRRYGLAGAQPPEVLCSMLQRAWDDAHPVELLSPGGGEACGEDGCAVR